MTKQVQQPDDIADERGLGRERRGSPPDLVDSGLLLARTTQLACEGAVSLLFRTSVREVWEQLVRAGLDWETEFTRVPPERRLRRTQRT